MVADGVFLRFFFLGMWADPHNVGQAHVKA